ncbi:hypothetical protein [Nocardia anaemiae]|uniref:hypothetical protein n=1 Tax=Nocardia anaemiae TaxID=263910 RepID=UPI000AE1A30C|nr:hypothetical protein [Nocardia anaemiae]
MRIDHQPPSHPDLVVVRTAPQALTPTTSWAHWARTAGTVADGARTAAVLGEKAWTQA